MGDVGFAGAQGAAELLSGEQFPDTSPLVPTAVQLQAASCQRIWDLLQQPGKGWGLVEAIDGERRGPGVFL